MRKPLYLAVIAALFALPAFGQATASEAPGASALEAARNGVVPAEYAARRARRGRVSSRRGRGNAAAGAAAVGIAGAIIGGAIAAQSRRDYYDRGYYGRPYGYYGGGPYYDPY